jgi:hypothetical protein
MGLLAIIATSHFATVEHPMQEAKSAPREITHLRRVAETRTWPRALRSLRRLVAVVLALPLLAIAQTADKPFSSEQLDQMLAQIALYPDSLLSQVLMATTYPDEFEEAYKWSKAHPDSKGDDAVKEVESNDWDPSVASMVAFPEVLITLGEKPDYVKDLGDAFLAQPDDVMDSVQRLRAAAQKAGNLESNEQVKVSTEAAPPPEAPQPPSAAPQTTVVQAPAPTETIVIEPAQPSVVYVPTYNPTAVYGPWWYPSYPPYYYPPPPGYWFSRTVATGIAWGVGIGVTNALWGGFNWGRGDVDINVNRYNNINVNKRLDVDSRRTNWSHDSRHRQTAYRGGDATRQQLDQKRASNNRQQFRGKDLDRTASRERAQQSMQNRGVQAPSGSARQRAETASRDNARQRAQGSDRGGAQQRAQNVNRDAARQRAQSADRSAAQARAQSASRDNALRGASSSNARAQQARGQVSAQSASQRGGGAHARGGGGGARASGSGGHRGGGGGGRGGGGRRR